MHATLKINLSEDYQSYFCSLQKSHCFVRCPVKEESLKSDWLTLCVQPTQAQWDTGVRRVHEAQIGNEPNAYLEV